ncbi:hypothetical protein [Mesobacillus maritimus]|uniref:Uncharacterized protein n=1 Tax=Mesobacillus maritimus TaxID=1643336 RepID=A0ABS7K5D3_9BACI|nr:hypothetical protein [Mesobacillus maritimus]MBY0097335.1 hypothetical protein [Mesobacillus maritimus]
MMSKTYFMTPEERMRKKARDKKLLYASLIVVTVFLSTAVTFLANQL